MRRRRRRHSDAGRRDAGRDSTGRRRRIQEGRPQSCHHRVVPLQNAQVSTSLHSSQPLHPQSTSNPLPLSWNSTFRSFLEFMGCVIGQPKIQLISNELREICQRNEKKQKGKIDCPSRKTDEVFFSSKATNTEAFTYCSHIPWLSWRYRLYF